MDATSPDVPASTRQHLNTLGDAAAYKANWRDAVFVEYYYVADNDKCVECPETGDYPKSDTYCANLDTDTACWNGIV